MGTTDRPEVTVSPKQIVFLAMIAVMAAVVAFLCGVQVGRGLSAPVAGGAGSVAAVAALDLAAGVEATPAGLEEGDPSRPRLGGLSYFERLRGVATIPETLAFAAAPAAAAAAPAGPPGPRAPEGAFVVQVMSVRGAAAARNVRTGLEAKGYPVVVEPLTRVPGALHRVRVGPFTDRVEAERVSRRLRTEERFEPWVTQP